jgi:hypothetical protein
VDEELSSVDADGVSRAADWGALRSPETYLGAARGAAPHERRPDTLTLNEWTLAGEWSVGEEAAVLDAAGGSIAFRFEGRDVNLVLACDAPARLGVRLDGRAPGDDHGVDVDGPGESTLSEPRMYQLIRQRGPVRQRTFEITFHDPGVRAYVFTFG